MQTCNFPLLPDIPCIDCIIMSRPTRSSLLFQQMVGRGLRSFEGKKDCLVLDLVDSCANDLVTVPSLLGLNREFDAGVRFASDGFAPICWR
jgi:hypothetical protein